MIESLDIVTFRCGTWRLGIEASRARSSRIASADDDAIAELAPLIGLTCAPTSQVLTIKTRTGDQEYRVGGPVQLQSIAASSIHPAPPLLAARTSLQGLRAFAEEEDALILLMDFQL